MYREGPAKKWYGLGTSSELVLSAAYGIFHADRVSTALHVGLLQYYAHVAQHAFTMAESPWKFSGGRLQEF